MSRNKPGGEYAAAKNRPKTKSLRAVFMFNYNLFLRPKKAELFDVIALFVGCDDVPHFV